MFPPEEGLISEATTVNNFALDDVPVDNAPSQDWEIYDEITTGTPFAGDVMMVDNDRAANDDAFWDYADTVLADALTFNEICEDLFVVQSWNMKSRVGGVSRLYIH